MSTVTLSSFDTLRYVKRLKEADVPEKQAEAQAEALREVLAEQTVAHVDVSARAVSESDSRTEKAVLRLEGKIDKLYWMFGTLVGIATAALVGVAALLFGARF